MHSPSTHLTLAVSEGQPLDLSPGPAFWKRRWERTFTGYKWPDSAPCQSCQLFSEKPTGRRPRPGTHFKSLSVFNACAIFTLSASTVLSFCSCLTGMSLLAQSVLTSLNSAAFHIALCAISNTLFVIQKNLETCPGFSPAMVTEGVTFRVKYHAVLHFFIALVFFWGQCCQSGPLSLLGAIVCLWSYPLSVEAGPPPWEPGQAFQTALFLFSVLCSISPGSPQFLIFLSAPSQFWKFTSFLFFTKFLSSRYLDSRSRRGHTLLPVFTLLYHLPKVIFLNNKNWFPG